MREPTETELCPPPAQLASLTWEKLRPKLPPVFQCLIVSGVDTVSIAFCWAKSPLLQKVSVVINNKLIIFLQNCILIRKGEGETKIAFTEIKAIHKTGNNEPYSGVEVMCLNIFQCAFGKWLGDKLNYMIVVYDLVDITLVVRR